MGASCSCGRTDPVSGLVCHCMLSPDIISCILAQLPLDHWEVARELHSTWAKAVRCKARESTHARLLGWHPGLSEGTFTWPTCVASQPDGGIVVSEAWSHRVRVFDRTGREKAVIGSAGREPGLMIYPSGVAVDQSGHIFVVDSGNHRVQKLSVHGEAICSVGSAGSGDGQFGNPKTIVLASNNLVVISDAGNHRLTVFDKELRWQRHIGSGTEGASDSQFNTPEGLAVWQGRGRFASPLLFVADSENHRVQVLSLPSGKFVRSIGGKGEGSRPGEFALPGGVAVDASRERLLVSECRGRRVQLLSLRGEPLQLVWLPRSGAASRLPVLRSVCCSVDEDGRAYVCDFANHRVAILRLLEP